MGYEFDEEKLYNYNQDIREVMLKGFRVAHAYAFHHTVAFAKHDEFLKNKLQESIENQKVYLAEEDIPVTKDGPTLDIHLHNRRSFEALPLAKSKKVAVLNFANAFSAGGAPETGSAQEESLCRASTLYPCLESLNEEFYQKHREESRTGKIDIYGTDDIIFTPNVIQFKTDASIPLLLDKQQWQETAIITCAAPDLRLGIVDMQKLIDTLERRLDRILRVAKANGIETIILGAWGCGVFRNPARAVAESFKTSLKEYHFEQALFAVIDNSMQGVIHNAFEEGLGLELEA